MKIGSVSSLYGVYKTKPAVSRTKTAGSVISDSYDVSSEAKDYNTVYKYVMQTSDIREDKINSISQKLAEGSYSVSAEAVADKILFGA